MSSRPLYRAALLTLGMSTLMAEISARADVGPPVEIKIPLDTKQAVSGQEFTGVFEVNVFKAGTLSNFQLAGEGWNIRTVSLPAVKAAQPGILRIPFTAVPTDADQPIGLSLRWNGRLVRQTFEVGPSFFARAGKPYRLVCVPGTDATSAEDPQADASGAYFEGPPDRGGARHQFWFEGRIVYSRPGRDLSDPPDGDFDDPGEIPPVLVGADTIDVQIWDNDTIGYETVWSGLTDENGYFTTPLIDWPGSEFDPDPDLILYCETEVTGVVDVTDNSNYEYTYSFDTDEIEDFTGSYHNFGTLAPGDPSVHPALHIFNSVVRSRRFIAEKSAYVTPEVQVEWPDDSKGGGAWYEHWTTEIHMSTETQWRNDTVSHEYGHHFIYSTYDPDPPPVDYCNEICDPDYPDDCGHCIWCQENVHDAWNEGFPNWLADIVMRDYPERYTHQPSGIPFVPLYVRPQESPGTCDGVYDEVLITEGFVGALLRDIEDQTQDDHDDDPDPNAASFDGVFDIMCTGPEEIFHTVVQYQPITVLEFIDAFLARNPELTGDLWPTAFNVGGSAYVSGFPTDTQPPGAVLYCNSPTHPLGEGGSLPCITFEWWPASDDVRGASAYSFLTTTDPAGEEPDEIVDDPDELVWGTDSCTIAGTVQVWELGEHYFCIKACDNAGNWSSEWSKFGPFEVIDCNGNGILDACDIDCYNQGEWGICWTVDTPCNNPPGCGQSSDCDDGVGGSGQPNLIPDECDIADGTSEDCNLNAVPDECEDMFHWIGESGSWHVGSNWLEGTDPNDYASVCINVAGDQTVTYSAGLTVLAMLACVENLNIIDTSTAMLTLDEPSWINGDLGISGNNSTLAVDDRLNIGGLFTLSGYSRLTGSGQTVAYGGVQMNDMVYLDEHHLILDGASTSVGDARVEFVGDSTFEIRSGSSYEHQGGAYFLNGSMTGDNVVNAGTLIKSVDLGESQIRAYTQNQGLVHVQTGKMTFYYGGSHTGDFLGESGTTLEFHNGQGFLVGSSIVADQVRFPHGGHTIQGTYDVTTSTVCDAYVVNFTDDAGIVNYGPAFYVEGGDVNFDKVHGEPIQFETLSIRPGDGAAHFNSGDPLEIENFIIGRGMLECVGDVTITESFTWYEGGDIVGTGDIYADCDVLVNPSGDQKTLSNCTFNNAATATFLGGINRGSSVFNNLPTGVMDIQADVGVFNNSFSDPFNNAGVVVKSTGAGTATFRGVVSNTGTIEVQSGVLCFTGSYGGAYTQTDGQTVLNGGDLCMTPSAPFQINGGLLTGAGTITANALYLGGTMAPGLPIGAIDMVGAYSQTTAGTLEIEIAGLDQGAEYDLLTVTGTANLAGYLEIVISAGFEPMPGDIFQILTANNMVGQFDTVNTINLSPYLNMEVIYSATDVTLVMTGVVEGDCDLDGDADLDDFLDLDACLLGPGEGFELGCRCFDFDDDGDVDMRDFVDFQVAFSGP